MPLPSDGPDLKIVLHRGQYNGIPGLAGDPLDPIESRGLFGIYFAFGDEFRIAYERGWLRDIDPPPAGRKFMRVNVQIVNVGNKPLKLNAFSNPTNFVLVAPGWPAHMNVWKMALLTKDGAVVTGNFPPVWCDWNSIPAWPGLERPAWSWNDITMNPLFCTETVQPMHQWIDITDVPNGNYDLKVWIEPTLGAGTHEVVCPIYLEENQAEHRLVL